MSAPLADFDRLAPQIERTLEYAGGEYGLEDIRAQIEAGTSQLWPGLDSVVITEVLEKPRAKVLYFFLAAGNMEEVRALYPTIIEWGKSRGCTRAAFAGRYGWARTFLTREEGWRTRLALYEKDLV